MVYARFTLCLHKVYVEGNFPTDVRKPAEETFTQSLRRVYAEGSLLMLLLFCSRCQPAGWLGALLLLALQPAGWTCDPPLLALPACRLDLHHPGRVALPRRARIRSGYPSRFGP